MSDKKRWSVMDESAAQGDLRTLALATPPIDREKVDRLIQYQTAFVEHMSQVPTSARKGSAWDHWLAKAHEKGLALSGLEHGELSRISAMCSDFCLKRRSEAELRRKREALAAKPGTDPELLAELDKALFRLSSSTTLAQRYGQASLDLLKEREADLLRLHEELWRPG